MNYRIHILLWINWLLACIATFTFVTALLSDGPFNTVAMIAGGLGVAFAFEKEKQLKRRLKEINDGH